MVFEQLEIKSFFVVLTQESIFDDRMCSLGKNMRVLHWSQLFPPSKGGIEAVVWELMVGAKKLGCAVDVLCSTDEVKSNQEVFDESTIYYCSSLFKSAGVYFSFACIKQWFRLRNSYDLVHVHLPHPLANLGLFLGHTDAKIVVHWHSDIVRQKRLKLLYQPLQNWLLKRADAIIATSPTYAASSSDLANFKDKLSVIPIGIDSSRLTCDEGEVRKIREKFSDKFIIFSLGRHVYYKGFRYLIQAMTFLSDGYVLLLGGEGPLTEALKREAEKLGVADRIVFLGKVSDESLGSYYASCDAFCLPSVERSEAFGVVQLEAMSFGKPVVSTSIPGSGVGWVNKDDVSGRVVPPRDAGALASAIQDLAANPLSPDCILEYFENNFSASEMARQVVGLYHNLLNKNEK